MGPLSATSVLPFCGPSSTTAVSASTSRRRNNGAAGASWFNQAPLEGERVRRQGVVVTTPARTIVDLAVDEADYLRLDWTDAAPRRGRKGAGLLSSVLAVHEPGTTRTRSELEERFLAVCDDHSIPRPEVNVEVEGCECDFVWTDQRRARKRDPVRDARLMAAGWRVWRVSWEEVAGGGVAEQLGRLLTPAPAAPVAPRPR